jgi:hypothetical protein
MLDHSLDLLLHFLLQYQYTVKDHQISVSPLSHNQNLPRACFCPGPQGTMPTNADRDQFEATLVAEHNKNNPGDPIFAVGSKEEIEAWVARLASRESAKKQRRKAKEEPRVPDQHVPAIT